MNKRVIVVVIGFLWVIAAIGIILSKQYTLRTGKTLILETLPVDPRDFLRGDYVILRYKISELDLSQIKSEKPYYNSGESVFVELQPRGKFWEAVAVYEKKDIVSDRVFLKGEVEYRYRNRDRNKLMVDYGIGSYFVPEGEGKDIERNMRGSKSAVSVEVVVDSRGNAVIKRILIDK